MDNQIVEFIQNHGNVAFQTALQFVRSMTPQERQRVMQLMREGAEVAWNNYDVDWYANFLGWLGRTAENIDPNLGTFVRGDWSQSNGTGSDEVPHSNLMSNTQDNQPQPTKVAATASRAAGPERNVVGGGETSISPQKPHYGVPFTTTTILPYTTYFTACTNSNQNMFNFYLRLNSPFDPLETSIATDPAAGGALTAGLYKVKPGDGQSFTNPLLSYPKSSNSGTFTNDRPQWRLYYEKLYNKYTVLGCEYEITFYNPTNFVGRDVAIAVGKEALSAANNGRVYPTNVPVEEAEYWHGLEWKLCRSYNDGTTDGRYVTFKGYYRPGDTDMNVQNDEDIKLWTTAGSTPTLNERLMIGIAQAAFNSDQNVRALQVKAKMKYIVQWKDLNVNLMFPASGQTAFTNIYPNDILDFA